MYRLRAIYMGEEWVREVEGGFCRTKAQEASVVVDLGEREVCIPWRELDALRAEVQRRPAGSAPAGIRVRGEGTAAARKGRVRR